MKNIISRLLRRLRLLRFDVLTTRASTLPDRSTIARKTDELLDRIVSANNSSVISAHERNIAELETQKLVLEERSRIRAQPRRTYEEMFELALVFLSGPSKYGKKGNWPSAELCSDWPSGSA